MSILRFQNVSLRYDNTQVLRDVYFRLDADERVGLIGKNGSGKTTLLRLLIGQLEPTGGRVERDAGITIGYFSQFSELDGELSILHVLEQLFAEVRAWEQELADISARLERAEEAELTALLARQSQLIELMNHRDGWEYEHHIDVALTRLGFSAARRAQPIDQLSGGWRNRAALATCLLEQPDVLLLDEPTNFLDIAGVAWLENWLMQFRGGADSGRADQSPRRSEHPSDGTGADLFSWRGDRRKPRPLLHRQGGDAAVGLRWRRACARRRSDLDCRLRSPNNPRSHAKGA